MGERGNRWNRRLDYFCGIPLAMLSACTRFKRHAVPARVSKIGILCFGAIGDLLLLSALVGGLRKAYPEAHISLIVSKANITAVPLLPNIDSCQCFGVRQILQIIGQVRSEHFDVLIDTTQWARLGNIIANLSGAKYTVGFKTATQFRGWGYDCAVEHSAVRHEVENFLALGRATTSHCDGSPMLQLPPEAPSDAIGCQQLADNRPMCFLHMWPSGINSHLKEWPALSWADLAKDLVEKGFCVFFTGSPGDVERTQSFLKAHLESVEHVHSIAGELSLPSLAWLLARAAAVVSVNTGIMHLAALVGAPTVGLHGATNPLRWGPVGPKTVSLLPRSGQMAYLNLGFEYPKNVENALPNLPVADVSKALHSLGVF